MEATKRLPHVEQQYSAASLKVKKTTVIAKLQLLDCTILNTL